MFASLVSQLPRFWIGKLAHYGQHRNDEHCAGSVRGGRPVLRTASGKRSDRLRRTGRRCRCTNGRSSSCFWSTEGWSSERVRRGTSRLRAAAARRVLGRTSSHRCSPISSRPSSSGRTSPRAEAARSFAPGLTRSLSAATRGLRRRLARWQRAVRRPPACRRPPGCRHHRNSAGRPAAAARDQGIAEPPVFVGARGAPAPRRIGDVDQVEPYGRVADQCPRARGRRIRRH